MAKKMKAVVVGSVVAFNELADAEWFDVLEKTGDAITIREHGTNYREQYFYASCVKQVK